MMLKSKRRFTAFFLSILMSLILSLDSPASYLDDRGDLMERDGGHTSGIHVSNPGVPISLFIAERESQDEGESDISSLEHIVQPPIRRTYTINSDKPKDIFVFLGPNYQGVSGDPNIKYDEHIQNYESAMVFYDRNQGSSSEAYNWDNIRTFMQETDKFFFNTVRPISFLTTGTLGALIGCVTSTPATGTLISSIGDFFHIPIGEGISTALVAWTMPTTTPCFAMHLAKRGYIIADSLFGEEAFPTRSGENESKPCVIKTSTLHKTAIGVLLFASGLDATVNIGVVALAYLKYYPNVFYGTSWAYFMSWGEWNYTSGRTKIDRLFCKYQYDTELSHRKRLFLLESVQKCQQAIANSNSFVEVLYNKIFNRIKGQDLHDEEIGSHDLFALSALFLQSANTIDYGEEEEENESSQLIRTSSRLMNFQAQQDIPLAWKEEFLDELSTYLTGAAAIGRIVSMEYILEQLFIHMFSASAPTATGLAWAASVFDLLYRSLTEGDAQKKYMKGWLQSFSLQHLGDYKWVRKIAGWPAIINGSLFALAKTVAGIASFNAWGTPIPLQVICLLPSFIQEQGNYGAFFATATKEITTNVATVKQPQLDEHINVQRAWLMKWSRKIEEYLTSQWDSGTIGNLYSIILKSF